MEHSARKGIYVKGKGESKLMLKKIGAVLAAAAMLTACLAGCRAGGKEYSAISQAMEAVRELESGRILVTAGYEKASGSDRIVTEFVFKRTDSGNYAYCQTQYDRNNKTVYCEYSDGSKTEQWLIGKGWADLPGTLFTPESPHRYIRLLSTPPERDAVAQAVMTPEDTNCRYDLTLDPEFLNRTMYADGETEVVQESVCVLLNEEGGLLCYNDDALVNDLLLDQQISYTLEMQLSEQNSIGEVTRPELRDNYLR